MGRPFGLRIAKGLLLELADETPAFVVRRFDRYKRGKYLEKLACEDMQQILGGPDKYAGSHEQIGRAIRQHCTFAPLELHRLFELIIFNFAIRNGDAHRKNFSLLTDKDGNVALSPACDLVSSRLAIPNEQTELALTLNGKRNTLNRTDFLALAGHLRIARDYADRKIHDLLDLGDQFTKMIAASQLNGDRRNKLEEIVSDRLDRLR